MKTGPFYKRILWLLSAVLLFTAPLSACSRRTVHPVLSVSSDAAEDEAGLSGYIVAIEEEPDTVDFQCTSIHYTIAQNVFNRLVEMEKQEDGSVKVMPSLARTWDISDDGRSYTFHLQEDVRFSNGSPLTSSDVLYTLTRLLTHPDSCNRDIAETILGASQLESGTCRTLRGFQIHSKLDFTITLDKPSAAFLACMSMPGASILDEQTTEEAGERFGRDPLWTIGTGPFILDTWEPGKGILLSANPDCWEGPPACKGMDLRFLEDSEVARQMFESGEIDILDLDELGNSAEFFIHGDIYQDRLYPVQQIGINYIALNESTEPLADKRVRKTLQLALNRDILLEAVYSGRGTVENGIFPVGLIGHNPALQPIPFDLQEAVSLLREAGYSKGFDLTFSVKASSTQDELVLAEVAASMWKKAGIRVSIELLDDDEFMSRRKSGQIACYTASWIADYDDPENFIYTFFGNNENSVYRSLCYDDEEVMKRVRDARTIVNTDERIREYQELERIIVSEDAAWIPLFSRLRYYVTSERISGFRSSWNGSVKNNYRHMAVNG